MFNKVIGFFFALLLLYATAGFAQSPASQTVHIAKGKTVTLKANSNGTIYQWFKDDIVIQGATNQTYIATSAGSYTVLSYKNNGCSSDMSDPINIIIDGVGSTADIMITKTSELKSITLNEVFEYNLKVKNNGPDQATTIKVTDILPKQLILEQLLNPAIGVAKYQESTKTITWEIPKLNNGETADLRIKVKTNTPGSISNLASAYAVETDSKLSNNISIDVKQITGISIPNVFTPNNDGKNDVFVIKGLESYELNEVAILNRWGNIVYIKKGYTNDWLASKLSVGTYFYYIKVKANEASKWEEFRGYLTLMR